MSLSMQNIVCTRQNVFCFALEIALYSNYIAVLFAELNQNKRNFSTLQCVGTPKNVDILENVKEWCKGITCSITRNVHVFPLRKFRSNLTVGVWLSTTHDCQVYFKIRFYVEVARSFYCAKNPNSFSLHHCIYHDWFYITIVGYFYVPWDM